MKKPIIFRTICASCSYSVTQRLNKLKSIPKTSKLWDCKNLNTIDRYHADYCIVGHDKVFYKSGPLKYCKTLASAETWLVIMSKYEQFENLEIKKVSELNIS